jgi:hypothetical protein
MNWEVLKDSNETAYAGQHFPEVNLLKKESNRCTRDSEMSTHRHDLNLRWPLSEEWSQRALVKPFIVTCYRQGYFIEIYAFRS